METRISLGEITKLFCNENQSIIFYDDYLIEQPLENATKAKLLHSTNSELFFVSEFDLDTIILLDNLDTPHYTVTFTRKATADCFGVVEKQKLVGNDQWEVIAQFSIFSYE